MENLADIRDELQALPALLQRRAGLAARLQQAEAEAAALQSQYEKEKRDVEHMEKESLSAFMLRVLGRYDKKREKEIQEEIEAKARYDKAAAHALTMRQEVQRADGRIAQLQSLLRQYNQELDTRRRALLQGLGGPAAGQFRALEEQRGQLIAQATEVREATEALQQARATAEHAQASLGSAESWATWDVWGGKGILSHMAKYSHIDDAEYQFNRLASQLRELQSELADVQGLPMPSLYGISGGQRAVDFWFDNIFTDLSVRGQIRDNAEQVRLLLETLRGVEGALAAKRSQLEGALAANRKQQEDLLVATGGAPLL